ncbi:MAG TPA: hypothetical protein VIX81_04775 [Gammaproteobacteria bacterium]
MAYLMMSPFLIVAGLLEGIGSLPYFLAGDLHEMNESMMNANTRVTLDQTYRQAYDTPLAEVPKSGDTGKVFRHMAEATPHFQQVLRGYGVEDADKYYLTAIRTADRDGYTLYGVIYRESPTITVRDKENPQRVLTLGKRDRAFWQPYAEDADGRPLDTVIDWAGVPRSSIRTQKGQAILMTLAANSVLVNRRSDDYWAVESRWTGGGYLAIVNERKGYLDKRLGLDS